MARRRVGGPSASERRHARNLVRLDLSWRVYCRCFICGREAIVNHKSKDPKRFEPNRIRGRVVCGKCGHEDPDWALDFILMYDMLEFLSLKSKKAAKLIKKLKRPKERFYRRKRDAETAQV